MHMLEAVSLLQQTCLHIFKSGVMNEGYYGLCRYGEEDAKDSLSTVQDDHLLENIPVHTNSQPSIQYLQQVVSGHSHYLHAHWHHSRLLNCCTFGPTLLYCIQEQQLLPQEHFKVSVTKCYLNSLQMLWTLLIGLYTCLKNDDTVVNITLSQRLLLENLALDGY